MQGSGAYELKKRKGLTSLVFLQTKREWKERERRTESKETEKERERKRKKEKKNLRLRALALDEPLHEGKRKKA